jgi:hypothetical protein
MKPLPILLVALLLAAGLHGNGAHAQSGLPASPTPEAADKAEQLKRNQRMQDEIALLREGAVFGNPAAPPTDLAELQSFLRRLPGRFRIEGRIEGIKPGNALASVLLAGKITGVADCRSVGEGVGVDCMINATWPAIGFNGNEDLRAYVLNTFRPAVLVLGVDPNPDWLRVRTLLVTADGFSHGGLGHLADNTIRAHRSGSECFFPEPGQPSSCFTGIEMTADPKDGFVTLRLVTTSTIGIMLTLHPDADARADKELESLRAR